MKELKDLETECFACGKTVAPAEQPAVVRRHIQRQTPEGLRAATALFHPDCLKGREAEFRFVVI